MPSKRKLYKEYKKFIKDNAYELEQKFRLRRDQVNYLYTVVNIDDKDAEAYYAENEKISVPYIKRYIKMVDKFFYDNNMNELIALRKTERIDDFNWKVDFGFSLFDSRKRMNRRIIAGLIGIATAITMLCIFL